MDQPVRPKPSNAHKPRIRIRAPRPDGHVAYNVFESGELVIIGFDGQLPEVYAMVVAWYCTGAAT